MALSTPAQALELAHRTLAADPDDGAASYAHQAAGIVLRDRGELSTALPELRAALRSARRSGARERVVDVQATLGAAEAMAGHSGRGLARLESAAQDAHGLLLATVRLRRAYVLGDLGRFEEALRDLRLALRAARRCGDRLWEARILHNRAWTWLAIGALGRADADAAAAGRLFDQLGQTLESVQAQHNRAAVAAGRGDLPRALHLLDAAESRYQTLGVFEPELVVNRGHVLLAAGLATEAAAAAEAAIVGGTSHPVHHAELLLFAARAALAAEQPERAQRWARAALRLFKSQQRPGWVLRARLLHCQARYAHGDRTHRLLAAAAQVAEQLRERDDEEAALAFLLAARLAQARGQDALGASSLRSAAGYRRRGSALTRATGWLAAAMEHASVGDERGLLSACGRGLDALDEHRLLFGAAEIRAIATWHGRDLASFAIDAASRRASPRLMLTWTERSRAISLAEPSVRAQPDPELEQELGAVRDAARRCADAERSGAGVTSALQQRDAGERAVRRRRRQLSGSTGSVPRLDIELLLAELGAATLLSLVETGGRLQVLQVGHGRVRRHDVGPVSAAVRELDYVLFALRRAAYGRAGGTAALAARLEQAVLGAVGRVVPDGPVVVVPSTRFHALPWGLLPALADRPVAVAPSAQVWQRAACAATRPCPDRRVLLVAGPDLGTRAAEVVALASVHASPEVVGRAAAAPAATVDRVVAGMNGAWVAHIAAHGDFRADSPLFSSVRLDDGALFVHDLDRVRQAPRTVVLSACETGVGVPVGTQELLGLVSGLLRAGTASVCASVVPVHDAAAIPIVSAVHRALADGRTLPEAALAGRRAAAGDELAVCTAASFSVWGA